MSETIMFGTDEPSCNPVPWKIHADESHTTNGTGVAPGSRYPAYIWPTKPLSGQLEGGELQVFPVTSMGSPFPFKGSALESR
jgi:hypothetical protein